MVFQVAPLDGGRFTERTLCGQVVYQAPHHNGWSVTKRSRAARRTHSATGRDCFRMLLAIRVVAAFCFYCILGQLQTDWALKFVFDLSHGRIY